MRSTMASPRFITAACIAVVIATAVLLLFRS